MRDKDTPLRLVRKLGKLLPGCYEVLDSLADAKTDGNIWWPDWCSLPINAAYTYLVSAGQTDQDAAAMAAELTACHLWRKNKIVYAFDRDLAETLAAQAEETEDTDVLPAELLTHPPYPVIYIKAPGLLEETDGFWYWADYDINQGTTELRIQWVVDTFDYSVAQVMHILPGKTVGECVRDTIRRTKENAGEPAVVEVQPVTEVAWIALRALQLVLYLCSSNADIEELPPDIKMPSQKERKQKIIPIIDKAREIRAYSVGVRIGAAIRKSKSVVPVAADTGGSGSTKRPHSRRGHWHHYWTGPRDGDRALTLKWTAPTFIHADDLPDTEIVFIHPVQ